MVKIKFKRTNKIKIVKNPLQMQKIAEEIRCKGKKIGLVPTMGFLHSGHMSLVRAARKKCDVLVLSIFVNPTQFAPNEDFNRYPRDFKRDCKLASAEGTDIIFYPEPKDLYPDGFDTYIINERISTVLEGEFRPSHFKGVTTIVAKLFNLIKPHIAIFGQKDAQQSAIIKKMVEDLNFDLKIIVAPIVREKDGLAMSSRNIYLNEQEREDSLVLNNSIILAEDMIKQGVRKCDLIIEKMKDLINTKRSSKIDYVKIVDPSTLVELTDLNGSSRALVLLAVKIGTTRLIDNKLIEVK